MKCFVEATAYSRIMRGHKLIPKDTLTDAVPGSRASVATAEPTPKATSICLLGRCPLRVGHNGNTLLRSMRSKALKPLKTPTLLQAAPCMVQSLFLLIRLRLVWNHIRVTS